VTIKDHHLLCLGLLAKIGISGYRVEEGDYLAIRQAIQLGQNLGLPVDVKRFDEGKAIHRNAAILEDGK